MYNYGIYLFKHVVRSIISELVIFLIVKPELPVSLWVWVDNVSLGAYTPFFSWHFVIYLAFPSNTYPVKLYCLARHLRSSLLVGVIFRVLPIRSISILNCWKSSVSRGFEPWYFPKLSHSSVVQMYSLITLRNWAANSRISFTACPASPPNCVWP